MNKYSEKDPNDIVDFIKRCGHLVTRLLQALQDPTKCKEAALVPENHHMPFD